MTKETFIIEPRVALIREYDNKQFSYWVSIEASFEWVTLQITAEQFNELLNRVLPHKRKTGDVAP